jgi:RNA polymerase sigma-70 factor, ECF subfamily
MEWAAGGSLAAKRDRATMVDREQFLEAFLKHEANLRAFVAALVRNRQDCEDVFQETAMTLWRKYEEYDPQRPFGAWAKGIAAKKVLQCRTRSGRVPTPFSPETINTIADALERNEQRHSQWSTEVDALEKCAETLPEQHREILGLRYTQGWSIAQIAERLGNTPTALAMTFSRIRARLYDCVQQRLGRSEERAK